MAPDELTRMVSELPALAPHVEYLRSVATPSVDIRLGDGPGDDDRSRFGGSAYVPPDFAWPAHEQGVYRFLGQIRFEDIDSPPPLLPESGLLSIFFAAPMDSEIDLDDLSDEEWDALEEAEDVEICWQDPGYVIAYYWPSCDGFEIRKGAIAWRYGEGFDLHQLDIRESTNTSLSLTAGVDLPRHAVLRDDWPLDQEAVDCLSTGLNQLDEYRRAHLLGYPSFSTLAYDPTPGQGWIPLLTVDSILDWCWHDGDKLMVFIEKSKLAKQDFSQLKCDAG